MHNLIHYLPPPRLPMSNVAYQHCEPVHQEEEAAYARAYKLSSSHPLTLLDILGMLFGGFPNG